MARPRCGRGGECLQTLTGHSNSIFALAVTREGLIVTGSYDETAKVWTREGECLQTFTHSNAIRALAVTREGLIVTGSDDGRPRCGRGRASVCIP